MTSAPALIADIGGTHARFALVSDNRVSHVEVLRADDYPGIAAAAKAYLAKHGISTIRHAALSIASIHTPHSDAITLINQTPWNTTRSALKTELGLDTLITVNDFEALAHGITVIGSGGCVQVCGGTPAHQAPIGVIGPGTGLGMAGIVFIDGLSHVIASEGGNTTLPVTSMREYHIVEQLRANKDDGHVSAENAVSGSGLPLLYQAIAGLDGITVPARSAPDITAAALANTCPVAVEALDLFCHWLGVMAGNLALMLTASGGIYIAGGIVPQWLDYFMHSRFAAAFVNKGVYRDYLSSLPVYVVTHPYPALEGMRALLARTHRH